MTFNNVVDEVTQKLKELGYSESNSSYGKTFTVSFSNFELLGPPRANQEARNYLSMDQADPEFVLEHSTRRGRNLEVVLRLNVGTIHDFPEDVKRVLGKREAAEERTRRAADIERQYHIALAALDAEYDQPRPAN